MVTSVALAAVAFSAPAAAVPNPRTAVSGAPPVQVFQGETLDVTGVGRTSGGTIGAGDVTFVGVAGNADGEIESGSAGSLDLSEWSTGLYDVDGDGRGELSVAQPRVTDLKLALANGADVTNRRAPSDRTVTVTARFNFDRADGLDLVVRDPDGLDVAPEVASSRRIDSNGGTATLDFSDADPGRYTVAVEAGNLDAGRSVTVGIDTAGQSIALAKTSVVKGERVIATVHGDAGETYHVRIRTSHLDGLGATNAAAEQVFEATGDVTGRSGSSAQGVVYATVRLDDSGQARVAIRSGHLRADNTATIHLARGSNPSASTADNVDLRVSAQRNTITQAPSSVAVGERFVLRGASPQSDTVKAYARIGDRWEPLFQNAAADRYAEATVASDGTWELEVATSRVLNLPDSYRIGVAADARSTYAADRALTVSEFGRLVTASTTVRTTTGGLAVTPSARAVATGVGDELVLVGTAIGQGETVHLYAVSPRGRLDVARTESVRDSEFRAVLTDLETRGTYQVIAVGAGRNGQFKNGNTPATVSQRVGSGLTQSEAVEVVRDAYTGAGVDDQIVQFAVRAEAPAIGIDAIGRDGQVLREPVTVTGTSNRQDGTTVSVEVRNAEGTLVASAETDVDAATGTWSTRIDLSDVARGSYTVRATDDETSSQRSMAVVRSLGQTPTATATPTPSPTPTEAPTTTQTETDTPQPTTAPPTTTEPPGGQPGFGLAVAALAILAGALLALRRRR